MDRRERFSLRSAVLDAIGAPGLPATCTTWYGSAHARHFVARWLPAIEFALNQRAGKSRAEARVQARLNLAIIRGRMLDLLATGDLKGTTAALRAYARTARSNKGVQT